MKKISVLWTVIITLFAVIVTNLTTVNLMTVYSKHLANQAVIQNGASEEMNRDLLEIQSVFEKYFYYYDDDLTGVETYSKNVINSYLELMGDRYAQYWTAEEYDAYVNTQAGNYVGVGMLATYSVEFEAIEVLVTFPDSAAREAGILSGDIITAIDGVTLESLDEDPQIAYSKGIDMVVGDEGTKVTLTVHRDGKNIDIEVERRACTSLSVIEKMSSDGKTGVIKILQFDGTTKDQFISAVESLEKQGAQRFVFDLRGNPGGQLSSVCDVLSHILPNKVLLSVFTDAAGNTTNYYSDSEHVIDKPMAILTDGSTASAAELFTACLKDYKVAVQVGVKTFGKGCAQTIFGLKSGGAIKLTTSMYTSALTENYDGIGLYPDIETELSDDAKQVNLIKLAEAEDAQLLAAIAYFNGK